MKFVILAESTSFIPWQKYFILIEMETFGRKSSKNV